MRFFFIRHGETTANKNRIFQGTSDYPLTDEGKEEIRRIGKYIEHIKFSKLITTPLSRAKDSADIIMKILKNPPEVFIDSKLVEMNYGEWEGKFYDEIKEKYPDIAKVWYKNPFKAKIPKAEGFKSFKKRVLKALDYWKNSANSDENLLFVTHGGVIMMCIADFLKISDENIWKIRINNGSLTILNLHPEKGRIVLFNASNPIIKID